MNLRKLTTVAIAALCVVSSSAAVLAQDKMGDKKMGMQKGKMMDDKMMMGMSTAEKQMMMRMMEGMNAADKRTMMGMSMAEKRLVMRMIKKHGMSGGSMGGGSMMNKQGGSR